MSGDGAACGWAADPGHPPQIASLPGGGKRLEEGQVEGERQGIETEGISRSQSRASSLVLGCRAFVHVDGSFPLVVLEGSAGVRKGV